MSDKTKLAAYFHRRQAFLVAVEAYVELPTLSTPISDVLAVAQVLQHPAHGYEVHQPLLNPTFAQLTDFLHRLPEQIGPNDQILLYFAGHGIAQESNNDEDHPEGYLLPTDASRTGRRNFLAMRDFQQALEALPCRHLLLVLDCCFAGAFRWMQPTRAANWDMLPKSIDQLRFEYYAQDRAWQVLTSAAYNQQALDVTERHALGNRERGREAHSPFAYHFVRALEGEADTVRGPHRDGLITATEVYLYVQQGLERELRGTLRQSPAFFPLPRHRHGEYLFLSPQCALNLPTYKEENNPYKGLRSYETADHDHFYGRDAVVQEMLKRLGEQHFLVVSGASGTGKSSVVKAGLLPALSATGYRLLPVIRPGEHPMSSLMTMLDCSLTAIEKDVFHNTVLVIDQFEEVVTRCEEPTEQEAFLKQLASWAVEPPASGFRLILTVRTDFEPHFSDGSLGGYWSAARYVVPPLSSVQLREIIVQPIVQRALTFEPPELADDIRREIEQAPGALPLLSFTMSEMYQLYLENERNHNERCLTRTNYERLGGVVGALGKRADAIYTDCTEEHRHTLRKVMLRMVSVEGEGYAGRRVTAEELTFPEKEENQRVVQVLERLVAGRLLAKGNTPEGQPYFEPAHDALVRGWQRMWQWIADVGKSTLETASRLRLAATDFQTAREDKNLLWHDDPRLDLLTQFPVWGLGWFNRAEQTFIQRSRSERRRLRRRRQAELTTAFMVLTTLLIGAVFFAFQSNRNADEARRQQGVAQDSTRSAEKQRGIALQQAQRAEDSASVAQQQRQLATQERDVAKQQRDRAEYQTHLAESQNLLAQSGTAFVNQEFATAYRLATAAYHTDPNLDAYAALLRSTLNSRYTYEDQIYTLPHARDLLSGQSLGEVGFVPPALGRLIFVCGGEKGLKGLRLLDYQGHQQRVLWPTEQVACAAFSPDGKLLARLAKMTTGTALIITDTAQKEVGRFVDFNAAAFLVRFSPDGSRLLTICADSIRIHKLNGKVIRPIFPGSYVNDACFWKDGNYVLSASSVIFGQLWSTDRLAEPAKARRAYIRNDFSFYQPGFSRVAATDEWIAFSESFSHSVSIFQAGLTNTSPQVFEPHSQQITALSFSPNTRYLLTASYDNTVKIWNFQRLNDLLKNPDRHQADQEAEAIILKGHRAPIVQAVFSPDNRYVLTYAEDNILKLWDLKALPVHIRGLPDCSSAINQWAFAAQADRLAVGYLPMNNEAPRVDVTNFQGRLICSYLKNNHKADAANILPFVRLAPDGTRLLISEGQEVVILNPDTQESTWLRGHTDKVSAGAFSAAGQLLATVSEDKTLRFWNREGKCVGIVHTEAVMRHIAFGPNGRSLLMADANSQLWMTDLGGKVHWRHSTGMLNVRGLCFTPSSGQLVVYSGDFKKGDYNSPALERLATSNGVWQCWDIKGNLLYTDRSNLSAIYHTAISPDGQLLATAGEDGSMKLFALNNGQLLLDLPPLRVGQPLKAIGFSADGQWLTALGDTGINEHNQLRSWPVAPTALLNWVNDK